MPNLSQSVGEAGSVKAEPSVSSAGPLGENLAGGPEFSTGSLSSKGYNGAAVTPKNILALQRTLGNQAVQRLIQRDRLRNGQSKPQGLKATLASTESPAPTAELSIQREPTATIMREGDDDIPPPPPPEPENDVPPPPPAEEGPEAEGEDEIPPPPPAPEEEVPPPPPLSPGVVAAQIRSQVAEEEQVEDQIDGAAAAPGLGNLAGDVGRPEALGNEVENLGVSPSPPVAQAQLQAEGIRNPGEAVGQEAASPLSQGIKQGAEKQGIGSYLARGLSWTASALFEAVKFILLLPFKLLGAIFEGAWWLLKQIGSGAKALGGAIVSGVKAGVGVFKKKPVATSFAGGKTGYSLAAQGVNAGHNLHSVGAGVSAGSLSAASNFAKVNPWFAAVFGAISSALDLRSLISSLRKSSKLDKLAKDAKKNGADPELIEALEYAVAQKNKKAGRKGLSLFGGVASTTAGVLGILGLFGVLASNPVGWAILALGAVGGVIGIGLFLYKFIRAKTKENKGKAREKHAKKIWEGLQNRGDVKRDTALAAINALGLKEAQVVKPKGWELIKDKLASN
jgi:hypothetical protein